MQHVWQRAHHRCFARSSARRFSRTSRSRSSSRARSRSDTASTSDESSGSGSLPWRCSRLSTSSLATAPSISSRVARRRVDECAAGFASRQQPLLEQPVHRRHHRRVGDCGTEPLARFADVDFAGLPHDRHDLTLESAEAAFEHLARRLESPEQKRPVHHRERRAAAAGVSNGGERASGHEAARPRPLKIEPADAAVDVEDLADADTAPGRRATPWSPDRFRSSATPPAVASAIRVAARAGDRRVAIPTSACDSRRRSSRAKCASASCRRSRHRRENRRGDRCRHHRRERGLHRRSRAGRATVAASPRRSRRMRAPGRKFTVSDATPPLELRAQPVARCIQRDRAADRRSASRAASR